MQGCVSHLPLESLELENEAVHIQNVLTLASSLEAFAFPAHPPAPCRVRVEVAFSLSLAEINWRGCPSPEQNINPTDLHMFAWEKLLLFPP